MTIASITILLLVLPLIGAFILFIMLSNSKPSMGAILDKRIGAFTGDRIAKIEAELAAQAEAGNSVAEALRMLLNNAAGRRLEKSARGRQIADSLARADLKLRSNEWLIIMASVTVGMGAL